MRGLKFIIIIASYLIAIAAPFMGAWIEIFTEHGVIIGFVNAAPFMGAWIEMK